ncbi:tail fiber assembly protein [Escherichia coli]|nr:tail fiber assembly protein [Escherichia coli]
MSVGGWPEDGVEISSEEYSDLFPTPAGMYIDTVNGKPQWVDVPPPSPEQLEQAAEIKKADLRLKADMEINWRQDAVDIDEATEKEAADLLSWKKYRVLLMRVDTSNPEWPSVPED